MTVYELRKALEGYAPGAEVLYDGEEYLYNIVSVYKPNDIVYLSGVHRDERETNP